MASAPHRQTDDLREALRLAVYATNGVTDVVEAMHLRIASGPAVLGKPLAAPARLVTRLAYGNVRFVTRLVAELGDRLLRELEPLLGEGSSGPEREAVVAALNGVLGDWLQKTKSPLAFDMSLRKDGSGPRALVLVHGSAMNDRQWQRRGHDHGQALARDEGWTPVYVRYNSGLAIAENGRLLAERLDELSDVEEIAILAHSLGGLVARSACHLAEGRPWRRRLRSLVTLGTPHHGAPLERYGSLFEALLPLSSYSAPLARLASIRSEAITDMRDGLDLPLPAGVECHAIAGANDRLVPVASALGAFPLPRCSVVAGAGHLDLLSSQEAYQTIRRALSQNRAPPSPRPIPPPERSSAQPTQGAGLARRSRAG
jgi:pimeloyl-ACP methyl ester carboxylesterase